MRLLLALLFATALSVSLSAQCTSPDNDFSFTASPPLPGGGVGYSPGTVVDMCFTLEGFFNENANWVHSIIPEFGSGYDVSTLTGGAPPASCITGGTWAWYSTWMSCGGAIEATHGPGWAFDSDGGVDCGGSDNDGDPGNNFGDGPDFCLRTFCWTITTVDPGPACVNNAFIVRVSVNPDSETGSYGSLACDEDEPLCWPIIEDLMAEVNSPCLGEDFEFTGSFDAESTCGLFVEWIGPGGGVVSTDLDFTSDVEGDYTLRINSAGCEPYEAMVNASYDAPMPTLDPEGFAEYCFGETITLTAGGGDSYRFEGPNGQVSTSNPFSFTADADADGSWTAFIINGATCEDMLFVNISVAPELFPMATPPAPVCVGEDVTLTGTGAGPGGSYEWTLPNGNQVFGNPIIFTTEDEGTNNVTLTVYDGTTGLCTEDFQFDFEVFPLPDAEASALPDMACENEAVELFASGGVSYEWSTGESTDMIVVFPAPPSQTYTVTVTNAEGCTDETDVTVIVQQFLDAPIIECVQIDPSEVNFTWDPVAGADYYQIFISIDGGPYDEVDSEFTGTTYVIDDLDPETDVDIRIVPYTYANENCPGAEGEQSCQSPACDPTDIFLEDGALGPFCFDASSNDPIIMSAEVNASGSGQLTWSGPGIFFEDNPAEFFPVGAGDYDLTVTFVLDDGTCLTEEVFTVEVVEAASATIDLSNDDVCQTETVTVELENDENTSATYNWDFGGATVDSGTGNDGPFVLSFPAAGSYTVSLETILGECTDEDQVTIEVGESVTAPVVSCDYTTQDSIVFAWTDVPTATGYTVTVIEGPSGTMIGNTYVVDGLTFGQQVEITVTALGTDPCPDAVSEPQRCEAQSCPDVTLDITTPAATFCADGNNDPVDLEVTINNGVNPTSTIWSGPGVTGNSFDADDAGTGTHTISVTVTDENCPFTETVQFIVLALPTSNFNLTDEVCVGGTATATYTGSADPATTTFNWDFDGATIISGSDEGPYELSWSTAGNYEVSLAVNDGNCASMESLESITVTEPMPRPTVNCINPALDAVTFEWTVNPDADSYEVTLISGPAGTQAGNTYTVTGLNEGDEVTIEVVAVGSGVCGNSLPQEITCQAQSCDARAIDIDNVAADYCQDGIGQIIDLTVTVDGNTDLGTFDWQGPGVIGNTFEVDGADLGDNEIIVFYTEDGCTYSDTVIFTVFELPVASFDLDLSTACVGQDIVLNYTGAGLIAGSSYNWDFDGGDATPGTGEGPHTVSWTTPGPKTISLTVTENGCTSEIFEETVDIIAPLVAPGIACGGGGIDSVSFSWPDVPGATGYMISVNGDAPMMVTSTSIGVGNLMEGQAVTATIFALGDAPCGNGPDSTVTCIAETCPALAVEIDESTTGFCFGVDDEFHVLTIAQNSGTGNGTYVWSGPGVSNDTFYYAGLAIGDHEIIVAYTEGDCEYGDTTIFTIFAEPLADFSISEDSICLNETAEITYTGNAAVNATYNWDFDGGIAVPGTGPGPHTVSWDADTVNRMISLEVIDGLCTSETYLDSIFVADTLATPMPMCGDSVGLNHVEFEWPHVPGCTGYVVIVDGMMPDTIQDTVYVVDGQAPGSSVTITVYVLGNGPCGDSAPATITCDCLPCPDLFADFSGLPTSVCLEPGTDQVFTLFADVFGGTGNGFGLFNGPGVVGNQFDPAAVGPGTYDIFFDYEEEGPCGVSDIYTITVFETPEPSFTLDATTICINDDVIATYTGTTPPNTTFAWTSNGTPAVVPGPGPHSFSAPAAGTLTVSLEVNSNGCTATATDQQANVVAPPAMPNVSCTGADLNSISIEWDPVAGSTGYEITLEDGSTEIVTGTTYTLDGLLPDTEATIQVVAISDGICPNSEPGFAICRSEACPDLDADFSANTMALCLDVTQDQSFQLTATVGSGGNPVFVWSGNGVSGDVFDPAVAGVGNHDIFLSYTEDGPCTHLDTFVIRVFATPVATFSISDTDICLDESTTLTFTGTAGDGSVYNWTAGDTTMFGIGPHTLNFPAGDSYEVNLEVISGDCSDAAATQTILVTEPLDPVVLTCADQQLEEVTFTWSAVAGATMYIVERAGEEPDTVATTAYTVDGLVPEENVTITVRALGVEPCGDGPADTESCSALACPDITVNISVPTQDFCLTEDVERVIIGLTTTGGDMSGQFMAVGPGVVLENDVYFFDPELAGVGPHTITVDYVETAGCNASNSIVMNVYAVPNANIILTDDLICSTETTTVSYFGTAAASWSFDGATIVSQSGQTYELSWPTAGTYAVQLMVEENGCTNESEIMITVAEPLLAPAPFCAATSITSVTFAWPAVVGATAYSVSINGGDPFMITDTSYQVVDMTDNENVTISLIALGDEPCGNSESGGENCSSDPCFIYDLAPSVSQDRFCTSGGDAPIALEMEITGNGPQTGNLVWRGMGVTLVDENYFFDPTDLPPGEYTLEAIYVESICTTTTSITVNVFGTPEVSFNNFASTLCQGTATSIVLTNGDNAAFPNLTWETEGGTVTQQGNNEYALSWPQAGIHNVTLSLEREGCTNTYTFPVEVERQATTGSQTEESRLCAGTSGMVDLSRLLSGADAEGVWSPGLGSPAVVDPATGMLSTDNLPAGTYTYLYTIEANTCTDVSTEVEVEVQPAPIAEAGQAENITCDMGMVSLNAMGSSGDGILTYLWTAPEDQQDLIVNPTSPMIDVTLPGIYTLTVTSELGCTATDQVEVVANTEVPIPNIELSNITCFSADDGAILVAGVNGGQAPYLYSLNGAAPSPSNFYTGLLQGEYSLRVSDANGCFSDLFLDISEPEQLGISINLPNGVNEYNVGDRVSLTASIEGGNVIDTLIWEPDSLSQSGEGNSITFIANETQQIMVTVIDELGCRASDMTTILVRREDPVYIPSAFSPNGDNSNDIHFINADTRFVKEIESFLIFNRWGEAVYQNYDFQPNEPAQGWDGFHRGEPMNPAVFVYVAVVEMEDGNKVVYKGDITLLR